MPRDDEAPGVDTAFFDRVVKIATQLDDADFERSEPPPGLWDRISASIDPPAEAVSGEPGVAPATVVSLDDRRSRRTHRLLVAAAVLAVALATGLLITRLDSSPTDAVVASASLRPLEGTATADAQLVRQDSDLRLVVEPHDMSAAPAGQHYELWLLDRSADEPVSLGPMTGSRTVAIPSGVDTGDYDVVDISLQRNGETAHSGHSLLRGTLT